MEWVLAGSMVCVRLLDVEISLTSFYAEFAHNLTLY